MLQAHVQLKAEASLSFKALNKLENATYHILKWKKSVFLCFFNKNFQKDFFKKGIRLIKGKKAPVCFIGFKVLLCVQLPCVTTCRLRARFHPHPPLSYPLPFYFKMSVCLPRILKLFCLTTHKKLSGFVTYRGWMNIDLKRKKRNHSLHLNLRFNLEATLNKMSRSCCCFPTSLPYPSGLHV